MIKIENVEVAGWNPTIRGMRNPKNSWDRIDSFPCDGEDCLKSDCPYGYCTSGEFNDDYECMKPDNVDYVVCPNDHDLMMRLSKGGPVHAKYRRMIVVYLDITAPLYWWKEFDTYKVGTVANSCSTMHKIHAKEFTLDDFSCEHLVGPAKTLLTKTIEFLNLYRDLFVNGDELDPACQNPLGGAPVTRLDVYNMTKKDAWWQMIQLLPTSYNQKRTIMLNYEVLVGMYESRRGHKLDEWVDFCKWIETLPHSWIITGKENE